MAERVTVSDMMDAREARAQAQRQLRRALPGAHDRRQPMSISNLIIIFIITLIFIIILIIS